jgi:NB-ARC domain
MVKNSENQYPSHFGNTQQSILRLLINVGVYWADYTESHDDVDVRWQKVKEVEAINLVIRFSSVRTLREFLATAIATKRYYQDEQRTEHDYKRITSPNFNNFDPEFSLLIQNLELLPVPFFEEIRGDNRELIFYSSTPSRDIQHWRILVEQQIRVLEDIKSIGRQTKTPQSKTGNSSPVPHNIPLSGLLDDQFVGRKNQLRTLHSLLEPEASRVAIVAGGGYGKTELTLQFLKQNISNYAGGVCWIHARRSDSLSKNQWHTAGELIRFAENQLQLIVPLELATYVERVDYCFSRWRSGKTLLIFDDLETIQDYEDIKDYIPNRNQFQVLLTSRLKIGSPFQTLDLDLLTIEESLELLERFIGKDRVNREREEAEELMTMLENLPLAIEIIARHLANDTNLSLTKILKDLDRAITSKTLDTFSELQREDGAEGMTAKRGLFQAFDLTWQTLSQATKEIAYCLGINPSTKFSWETMEDYVEAFNEDPEELEKISEEQVVKAKKELIKNNLIKPSGDATYRIHSLTQAYFRCKGREA